MTVAGIGPNRLPDDSVDVSGASPDSANDATATSTAPDAPGQPATRAGRARRGPAFSACVKDRGKQAWRQYAVRSQRFDQIDYRESWGRASGGLCDGMVREAMRQLDLGHDRPGTGEPADLVDAVHAIRHDANSATTRADLFSRIERFQANRQTLGLHTFAAGEPVYFGGHSPTRGASDTTPPPRATRIAAFVGSLFTRLRQPGDLAYVQLSLESSTHRQDYGYALLIQRNANHRYTVFDPNNGAFQYADWRDTEGALRSYMNTAFSRSNLFARLPDHRTPFQLAPFRMQIYASGARAGRPSAPVIAPRDGPPPEPDCDGYAAEATSARTASMDSLFPEGATAAGLRHPWESLASYALQQVAGQRTATLTDAVGALQDRLGALPSRHASIVELNASLGAAQSASVADLPGHLRHGGALDLYGADALVDDLATHFSRPYAGDGGPLSFHDDLAVIDLQLRIPVGRSGGLNSGSRPVIVQRLNRAADFATDQYQLYDPNFGVYGYADFDRLSTAIRHMYNAVYWAEGGIAHATTTWFSNQAGIWAPSGTGTLSEAAGLAPRAFGNLTLDDADRIAGHAHAHPLVPPRDDLLPEPANIRAPIPDLGRAELKRAADPSPGTDPPVLFRPSTIAPDELIAQGGFDASPTLLRNISLQTHNFDVASHGAETDSAGYLGTFATPSVAVDRLRHQFDDGYVYLLAASPNMVDVNGSLGAYGLAPEDHEFAALGHLDATQVIGWWRIQQDHLSHFTGNPQFRWDVYGLTRTAGAQPQLARFPMDSPAWREPTWAPFVAPAIQAGRQTGVAPKQDPGLVQAAFHLDANSKLRLAENRQAGGNDYRGSMVLRPYGPGWGDILYTDAQDQVNVYGEAHAAYAADTTRQFVMGEDGRIHYPNDYRKVLRVGNDGYLYVGPVPDEPASLNGVFRYDGTHLIHVEDQKYVTVGKSVFTPFVTDYDAGSRSRWYLTDSRGRAVQPPVVNRNTYWGRTAGSRAQLYQFDRDPDSALPRGTTRFVTRVPGNPQRGRFLRYQPAADADQRTIDWLDAHHAAWLFYDGFYAVATGRHTLEVRTLGGTVVWSVSIDPVTGAASNQGPGHLASNYQVRDDVWRGIEERERAWDRLSAAF